LFLQRLTGLTKGNLSRHLARLEADGLVRIDKEFVGKVPRTMLSLTEGGRTRIAAHWEEHERLRRDAARWRPSREAPPGPVPSRADRAEAGGRGDQSSSSAAESGRQSPFRLE